VTQVLKYSTDTAKTNLFKETLLLVIIDTRFRPVLKQVPLAFIQQHLGKFNLQPPGNRYCRELKLKQCAL
jgi:hypothetical protein